MLESSFIKQETVAMDENLGGGMSFFKSEALTMEDTPGGGMSFLKSEALTMEDTPGGGCMYTTVSDTTTKEQDIQPTRPFTVQPNIAAQPNVPVCTAPVQARMDAVQ